MTMNRRKALKTTLFASAVALPAISYGRVLGSQEKFRCAVIGLNGRGQDHMGGLKDHLVALCDCDQKILEQRAQDLDVLAGPRCIT